jgi:tetratricopeptide (TPR) repeat protein
MVQIETTRSGRRQRGEDLRSRGAAYAGWWRWERLLLVVALFVLVTLVAPTAGGRKVASLEDAIESRGLDPRDVIVPFSVSEEMVEWVKESVSRHGRAESRLKELVQELLASERVRLEYRAGATGTAEEVFRTGKANCLSFTHTVVGLARSVGIPVYFMRADSIVDAKQEGDLVVLESHVTTGYGPPHERLVLDFSAVPRDDYRWLTPVSDLTAIAMFYSNRGAELLRENDLEGALEWLRKAIQIDPELSYAWVNLGVALRRSGDREAAQEAYQRALEADARALPAYHNLAALMQHRGEEEAAFELLSLTERLSSRDPYNYLALGDMSLRGGRLDEAYRYYRRASRLMPREAAGYAALADWALAAGQRREARRWLEKAQQRDPSHPRVKLVASKL